jgi:hypothetical protein
VSDKLLKLQEQSQAALEHEPALVQETDRVGATGDVTIFVWPESYSLIPPSWDPGHASVWMNSNKGTPTADDSDNYVSWWPRHGTRIGETVSAYFHDWGWDASKEDMRKIQRVDLKNCLDVDNMISRYATVKSGSFMAISDANKEKVDGRMQIKAGSEALETQKYSFLGADGARSCSSMSAEILTAGGAADIVAPVVPTLNVPLPLRTNGVKASYDGVWTPSGVLTWAALLAQDGKCAGVLSDAVEVDLDLTERGDNEEGGKKKDGGKKFLETTEHQYWPRSIPRAIPRDD